MSAKRSRVLILGGTGFVGPPAVQQLVELGHEVMVFHRGQTSASLPSSVRHLYGDRQNLIAFAADFRGFAPDVVLDLNLYNQQDAETVVRMFRGLARRLVVVSSADVYRARDRFCRVAPGPPDPTPLTEDSPLRERLFPYVEGETAPEAFTTTYEKILVERAVRNEPDLLATVLRLPMVYGPGDYQHRFFPYIKRMDDGRPFILLPEDIANWRAPRGFVEDIGRAIALCVTHDAAGGRIYHAGDQPSLTEAECVRRIGHAIGWQGKIVTLPNEALPQHLQHRYDARQDWSLDSSRIRSELHYVEATHPEVAIARTVEWERANPPKQIAKSQFDYAAEDAALPAAQ